MHVLSFFKIRLAPLVAVFSAGLSLWGCTTDFDVNAPYQEKAAIYAILDPDSTVQYVRINKAFQNRTGDARVLAKDVRDSSQYRAGEVEVSLYQTLNGREQLVARLQEVPTNTKELGDFYAPEQILYRTPAVTLQRGATATVRVRNTRTGYEASGTTVLVGRSTSEAPSSDPIDQPPGNTRVNVFAFRPDSNARGQQISLRPGCNIGAYSTNLEVVVRQFFNDNTFADTVVTIEGIANGNIINPVNCNLQASNIGSSVTGELSPRAFFQALELALTAGNSRVQRRVFQTSRLVYVTPATNFVDYLNINNNYSPVTQSKPTYSNVSSGLGLVTSRTRLSVRILINPSTVNEMNRETNNVPAFPRLRALKFSTT